MRSCRPINYNELSLTLGNLFSVVAYSKIECRNFVAITLTFVQFVNITPYRGTDAPVILSRFGRYVVLTLLTPTFRRNWYWFRLSATLCHDVLRSCHAVATPWPCYCPVLTRLTSDTGKFSYVVLRCVTLPPRCSLAASMSYAVPRNMMKHSVSQRVRNAA